LKLPARGAAACYHRSSARPGSGPVPDHAEVPIRRPVTPPEAPLFRRDVVCW